MLASQSLFLADGKQVFPFQATRESVERIVKFIRNFPLSTSWSMTDEEIFRFIMSPTNVFLETDNALISFEDVSPGLAAQVGFVFWDKRVAGNEKMLREIFEKIMHGFNLRRLTCYVPEKNRVMYRLLERIGFMCEGRLRDAFILPDGLFNDILIYGVLSRELAKQEPIEVRDDNKITV